MSWHQTYFNRAQKVAATSIYSAEYSKLWNALEDDIAACSLEQCSELLDLASERWPSEASMVLMSMLPDDLHPVDTHTALAW